MFSIAVASGKGGTGKTILSTNLARICADRHSLSVQYVDCDVEAPDGHLFLKPDIRRRITVTQPVPFVDESRCNYCGDCSQFCHFNAIAVLNQRVLVFPELCHGCGGCSKVCAEGAVIERERPIGVIGLGTAGKVAFAQGRLAIGETATVRLIGELRRHVHDSDIAILDAPPGTTCPTVASIRNVDAVVLVTEPTAFGLHDLRLAVEMTRTLGIPMGVVVNRVGLGDDRVDEYCQAEGVPIWGRIPDDREVAEAYSRGDLACEAVPSFRSHIEQFAERLISEMAA